jgi:hypothetical protein
MTRSVDHATVAYAERSAQAVNSSGLSDATAGGVAESMS